MHDAEADICEIWRRVLSGENPDAVLADLAQRDAVRRAAFEDERARLQAEIDACTALMLRHQGRLQ